MREVVTKDASPRACRTPEPLRRFGMLGLRPEPAVDVCTGRRGDSDLQSVYALTKWASLLQARAAAPYVTRQRPPPNGGLHLATAPCMSSEAAIAAVQSAFVRAFTSSGRASCSEWLAPDFSELRPRGDHTLEVVLRESWLAETDTPLDGVSITDMAVSVHGRVAVATALWVDVANGTTRPHHETSVWSCTPDGKWLLIERHLDPPVPI